MTACTFAGHREIFAAVTPARLDAALEEIIKADTEFIFYTGGMGEFDSLCSAAVRGAKYHHPNLNIQLLLVLPYMKQEINTSKDFYYASYDDIIVPVELMGVHYKGAIKKRNRWMVDHADILFACVFRESGGAYETLQYARKQPKISIINFAEKLEGSSMLTNEKVLEVFREYLAADDICEVVQTSRGYTFLQWNEPRREWYNVQLCQTPQVLRDALIAAYGEYLAFQCSGDEQDDPTPEQQKEIWHKCEMMLELCK